MQNAKPRLLLVMVGVSGAPNCYLDMWNKLQKRFCRTIGPTLDTSLEPLAHR